MMAMNKKTIAAVSVSLLGGVALAQVGHPPGHMYGLYNCGPNSGVNTRVACLQCCRTAYNSGTLSYQEWRDCRGFCINHANFPSAWRRILGDHVSDMLGIR